MLTVYIFIKYQGKNGKKTKNAGKILLESISHIGIRWTLCYLELLVLKPMYYNYTYLSTSFLLPVLNWVLHWCEGRQYTTIYQIHTCTSSYTKLHLFGSGIVVFGYLLFMESLIRLLMSDKGVERQYSLIAIISVYFYADLFCLYLIFSCLLYPMLLTYKTLGCRFLFIMLREVPTCPINSAVAQRLKTANNLWLEFRPISVKYYHIIPCCAFQLYIADSIQEKGSPCLDLLPVWFCLGLQILCIFIVVLPFWSIVQSFALLLIPSQWTHPCQIHVAPGFKTSTCN